MEVDALGGDMGCRYLVWWLPKMVAASALLWNLCTRASRARPPFERRWPHLLTAKVPFRR